MLNAVKHLLFAMLLRPVQSTNRSFTTFRMTNLLKCQLFPQVQVLSLAMADFKGEILTKQARETPGPFNLSTRGRP